MFFGGRLKNSRNTKCNCHACAKMPENVCSSQHATCSERHLWYGACQVAPHENTGEEDSYGCQGTAFQTGSARLHGEGESKNSQLGSMKFSFCSCYLCSAGLRAAQLSVSPQAPGGRRPDHLTVLQSQHRTSRFAAARRTATRITHPAVRGEKQSLGLSAESLPLDLNLLCDS